MDAANKCLPAIINMFSPAETIKIEQIYTVVRRLYVQINSNLYAASIKSKNS